jgi:hypothetical protein
MVVNLLMAIMLILLMVIGGYYISSIVGILLMAIAGYFVNGY